MRRAFTIIELLVVLGIAAILAGMSVLAIAPLFRGRAMASAESEVVTAAYEARFAAASSGAVRALVINSVDRSLYIADITDCPNVRDLTSAKRLTTPQFLPIGVNFAAIGGESVFDLSGNPRGQAIAFRPTGHLDPQRNLGVGPRKVILADGREIREVIVNLTGLIQR
mgnify:CR=1 FL=1